MHGDRPASYSTQRSCRITSAGVSCDIERTEARPDVDAVQGACDRINLAAIQAAEGGGVDLDADQLDLDALRREEAFLLRDEQRPVTRFR